jgi:hypothetical protein
MSRDAGGLRNYEFAIDRFYSVAARCGSILLMGHSCGTGEE